MAERLTALVPTKNEERLLGRCLDSVRWADEILVVDSGSTDRTLDIARAAGARILEHEYVDSAAQKNWAIPQARHPWVFLVDADECATPALQGEIRALLAREAGPDKDFYRIGRDTWFFGRRIRRTSFAHDSVARLFRREAGRYENARVHASLVEAGLSGGRLRGRLEHRTCEVFDRYMEKFNRYSTCRAFDYRAKGQRATWWRMLSRPAWRFFRMYVLQRGFLDGRAGLALCGLEAAQVFARLAKLWVLERQEAGEEGAEIGRTIW